MWPSPICDSDLSFKIPICDLRPKESHCPHRQKHEQNNPSSMLQVEFQGHGPGGWDFRGHQSRHFESLSLDRGGLKVRSQGGFCIGLYA